MKPKPWSYSALDTHENCPKMYEEKYILKNLPPEEKSAEQLWGTFVHENFDARMSTKGFELPIDLQIHEPYFKGLEERPGVLFCEQKVALGRNPFGICSGTDWNRVWWRGVIDLTIVDREEGRATIVDYKTGKKFDKWDQLAMNAVWTFLAYPDVNLVNAQFYWVNDQTTTKKVWGRGEIDALCLMFAPKLSRYITSFQTNTFTPKQSGLCKGWCPVKSCKFWEEKKGFKR